MTDPFQEVLELLAAGEIGSATTKIDDLLASLPADAPAVVRSRAARAAATAHRLDGNLDRADEHLGRAFTAAAEPTNDEPVVAIEAELELADLRRAQGRSLEAADAHARAETIAAEALVPELVRWRIGLHAAGHELGSDPERAIARLNALADSIPDAPAEALQSLPEPQQLLLTALTSLAEDDDAARTIDILESAAASARQFEDVAAYTGARVALAQIHEENGDRVACYHSLASGWATLRAALGVDLARQAFGPMMVDCRRRWGPDAFDSVRAAVESGERHGTR